MCGIAGFIGTGDVGDLQKMLAALSHRGPDATGSQIDREQQVYLGATRLAVIDIAGGKQPMTDAADRLAVVFNGEIYNHRELRRELEAAGFAFATDHSDTEVLLHGYKHWGDALPEKLNGMFAFAIQDKSSGRVFLARDRFGEKPLYYTEYPGGVAFASELTAVRAHSRVDVSLDPQSLRKYFAYGFFPAPVTAYKNVRKLPHGHALRIDVRGPMPASRPYWRFATAPEELLGRREDDLVDELRHLLSTAVERRLMSDVPIGVFLSGGIDSSAIAAYAARSRGAEGIDSFCLGFDEPTFDESGFARAVAEHISSRHHERTLSLAEALDLLPEVLARLDEPMGDPSILPMYLLCRFARERVTVALGGDGGDEMFAGYDPFLALRPATLYSAVVPSPLHRVLRGAVERVARSPAYMAFDFKLRRALRGLSYRPAMWNPAWLGPLEPDEVSQLLNEPVDPEDLFSEAIAVWDAAEGKSDVDRTIDFFANFYLPEAVLTKGDRASMMVSLEYRAPFLDNDLVEFARRLPSHMKLRGRERKYILKKAMRGLLPDRVIDRPKKGFGIPLLQVVDQLPYEAMNRNFELLDTSALAKLCEQHRTGAKDHRLFLWCLMSLGAFGPDAPIVT